MCAVRLLSSYKVVALALCVSFLSSCGLQVDYNGGSSIHRDNVRYDVLHMDGYDREELMSRSCVYLDDLDRESVVFDEVDGWEETQLEIQTVSRVSHVNVHLREEGELLSRSTFGKSYFIEGRTAEIDITSALGTNYVVRLVGQGC